MAMVLATPLTFAVPQTCLVTGLIWNAPDDSPDFRRTDHCLQVKEQMHDDALLVLYTRNWFVMIQIPEEIGHQRFWYRWGATKAHIEDKTIKVRWYKILAA